MIYLLAKIKFSQVCIFLELMQNQNYFEPAVGPVFQLASSEIQWQSDSK